MRITPRIRFPRQLRRNSDNFRKISNVFVEHPPWTAMAKPETCEHIEFRGFYRTSKQDSLHHLVLVAQMRLLEESEQQINIKPRVMLLYPASTNVTILEPLKSGWEEILNSMIPEGIAGRFEWGPLSKVESQAICKKFKCGSEVLRFNISFSADSIFVQSFFTFAQMFKGHVDRTIQG